MMMTTMVQVVSDDAYSDTTLVNTNEWDGLMETRTERPLF